MHHHLLSVTLAWAISGIPGDAPSSAPAPSHRLLGPMFMKVEGPARVHAGESVEITVRLTRRLITPDPITLSLEIPNGVTLEHGNATETIQDGVTAEITRTFRMHVHQIPASDLVVTAQASGESWFTHGRIPYDFGRLRPMAATVEMSTGPALSVRGANIGPTIPLDAPPR